MKSRGVGEVIFFFVAAEDNSSSIRMRLHRCNSDIGSTFDRVPMHSAADAGKSDGLKAVSQRNI